MLETNGMTIQRFRLHIRDINVDDKNIVITFGTESRARQCFN